MTVLSAPLRDLAINFQLQNNGTSKAQNLSEKMALTKKELHYLRNLRNAKLEGKAQITD